MHVSDTISKAGEGTPDSDGESLFNGFPRVHGSNILYSYKFHPSGITSVSPHTRWLAPAGASHRESCYAYFRSNRTEFSVSLNLNGEL